MTTINPLKVCAAIVCAMLTFLVGMKTGTSRQLKSCEHQCVKAGVAYWTNGTDGESVFKFKEIK